MQAKHLIIIAIMGILGLAIFNFMIGSRTKQTVESNTPETPAATSTPNNSNSNTVGDIPKATLDKATNQINQANADTADKMAQAEKATQ